ncbi:hypothetical protein ACFVQ0_07930 [Streptomyces sp. NPDC057900]|uniref:hypothetical protein n=1 Tax=Streptomyces sp. NPDC057900 TaxID=3346274 RepID=UPI0036EC7354
MVFHHVRTVMVFADDPSASAAWWGELLDAPVKTDISPTGDVYASPLDIEPGLRIAQLRDPFGTIIGIDGR